VNDRHNGDPADVSKAALDKRVTEALEAEYARERLQGRFPGDATGRRRALMASGVAILVLIVAGILWSQPMGPGRVTPSTTLLEAAADTTIPTVDTSDIEPQRSERESFVASLQNQGALVTYVDPPLNPIGLTGDALHVCLNGASLHIFEYATVADRLRESDSIISNGGVTFARDGAGTVTIDDWIVAQAFAQGRLIVLALGPDEATLETLTLLLGDTLTPDHQGLSRAGSCH